MSKHYRVALVTGSSRGIGRAIALRLAQDGARVGVNYLNRADEAQKVVDTIEEQGGQALALQADVTKSDGVTSLFQRVEEAWGPVEILVNNAGMIKDSLIMRMTDEDWDSVIDLNLRATFLCTRAAIREMVRHRWGRVINIGSVVGMAGNAGQANYSASKAGMIGLTLSVAREVAARQVTVNCVAPGFVTTDIVEDLSPELKEKILQRMLVGRFGRPEEIAHLVAYLASDLAGFLTGQVIAIDGGMLIS